MAQNVAIVNNEEINGVRVIAQQASSQGFSFSSPINLSNTPGNAILKRSSLDPHLAVAGSNVYLLWQDNTPGKYQIFFKRSTDGGASFDYAINLSKDTGPSSVGTINIATSGSNVYVVWEEDTGSGYELFFRRSTDKGASFGDTTNLGGNTNSLGALPKIVASRGNVYIIWEHTSTGNQSIFFTRSTDGGASFGDTINLSRNTGISEGPQIALSGSNVYVVWEEADDGEIFFTAIPPLTSTTPSLSPGIQYDIRQYTHTNFSPIIIDGNIGEEEWEGPYIITREMGMLNKKEYEVTFAHTYDDKNWYIVAAVEGPKNFTGGSVFTLLFDNNNNGHLDQGEDTLVMYKGFNTTNKGKGSFDDMFWDNRTSTLQKDENDRGTKDGSAGISFLNGTEIAKGTEIFNDAEFALFKGKLPPSSNMTGVELVPPASFILEAIERLTSPEREKLLAVLTSPEREKLQHSPTVQDIIKLLDKLPQETLAKFLNTLTLEELGNILTILSHDEFVNIVTSSEHTKALSILDGDKRAIILNDLTPAERAELLNGLTPAERAEVLNK
jgi:hypothetical protein